MSGQRLRLTTSRPAGYRRGGQVIGGAAAPTLVAPGDTTPEQMLALLADPNVSIDIETKEGGFYRLTGDERAAMSRLLAEEQLKAMGLLLGGEDLTALRAADLVPSHEPNTAEPQTAGTEPASEASGADASQFAGSANASDGSAADAGTTEPTAQPNPPAPDPAPPVSKGRAKPKPVKAKP